IGVIVFGETVQVTLDAAGSVTGLGGVIVSSELGATLNLAGAVSASGDGALGVVGLSDTGDTVINVNQVSVTGDSADAVSAISNSGDATVGVTGAVSSLQGMGVIATGQAVEITVAAGAEVIGGTGGIQAASILGTTINLAGSVSSASGYAIDVSGGAATINNTGNTIHGAVSLTAGDDVLNNAGSWF